MVQRGEGRVRQRSRGGAARTVLAVILVAAGAALVIYGIAWHSRTVLLKQDESFAAEIGETIQESEPALIREATVGGLLRNPSGGIERTYGESETPALCPT